MASALRPGAMSRKAARSVVPSDRVEEETKGRGGKRRNDSRAVVVADGDRVPNAKTAVASADDGDNCKQELRRNASKRAASKAGRKSNLSERGQLDSGAAAEAVDGGCGDGELVYYPPAFSVSEIKNKQRRHEAFMKEKLHKRKEKLALKKRRKSERKALGDKAPPRQVPKTIENQRVPDETIVTADDEEVNLQHSQDEFREYFARRSDARVLLTTSDRPRTMTVRLCEDLAACLPSCQVYYRRGLALKKIVSQCVERGFTDLVVVNQDRKKPNGLVISHLPDGPTAHFKMSGVKLSSKKRKAPDKAPSSRANPELIVNNFSTRLGASIARQLSSLHPLEPSFPARRVLTFHNQRDYIFFRHHRYIFRDSKRVGLKELGPRFTLKLRSLQRGTFDSKYGDYEWVHKRHEMDSCRRKFHL